MSIQIDDEYMKDLVQKMEDRDFVGDVHAVASSYVDYVIWQIHEQIDDVWQGKKLMLAPMLFDGTCYSPNCDEKIYGGTCFCVHHYGYFHRHAGAPEGLCDECHARTGKRVGNKVTCEVCKGFRGWDAGGRWDARGLSKLRSFPGYLEPNNEPN